VCRRALVEFEERDRLDRRLSLITDGDLVLEADEGRLGQVFSNVIGNALQHGGGKQVEVGASGRGAELVVTVHNDGPPIEPAELPHIFEPFWRGAPAHQARENGSIGLGLFIVSEIVKAHGGTVEVRSEAGSGTTFTVRLPRSAAS
jgi:signal transduction histidine kinase